MLTCISLVQNIVCVDVSVGGGAGHIVHAERGVVVPPWGQLVSPPRQQARVVWGAVVSAIQNIMLL